MASNRSCPKSLTREFTESERAKDRYYLKSGICLVFFDLVKFWRKWRFCINKSWLLIFDQNQVEIRKQKKRRPCKTYKIKAFSELFIECQKNFQMCMVLSKLRHSVSFVYLEIKKTLSFYRSAFLCKTGSFFRENEKKFEFDQKGRIFAGSILILKRLQINLHYWKNSG